MQSRPPHTTFQSKALEQLRQWVGTKQARLVAVVSINAALLLALSQISWGNFAPEENITMVYAKMPQPRPRPPEPPAAASSAALALDVPPPAPAVSLVVANAPQAFSMPKIDPIVMPPITDALPSFSPSVQPGLINGTGYSGGNGSTHGSAGFGGNGAGGPGLWGYFYDLKQTPSGQPTNINKEQWKQALTDMVISHLDEASLSGYFRSPSAQSTNALALPEEDSEEAPSAFGLATQVRPNLWAIVYHAKVLAPATGRFRFVGFGDDVLLARVNGTVVLDAGNQTLAGGNEERYPFVWDKPEYQLRKGDWFATTQGQPINVDILIGDWGGRCGFFLLVEQEGATYEKASDGQTPVLPLFQVNAPASLPAGTTPPIARSGPVWRMATHVSG